MERDVGDVLDRSAISKLKYERIGNEENIREYKTFNEEIERLKDKYTNIPINDFYELLLKINDLIWSLEADLRKGKLDGALSEVGYRAIKIRENNSLRVKVKNIVNKLTDTGFQDLKRQHLSE